MSTRQETIVPLALAASLTRGLAAIEQMSDRQLLFRLVFSFIEVF